MGTIPTVKLQKGSAVITVNADDQERWVADGYKPLEAAPAEPKPAPAESDDDVGLDADAPPKGKSSSRKR